jgi:Flp pilus assembly pilin Flp
MNRNLAGIFMDIQNNVAKGEQQMMSQIATYLKVRFEDFFKAESGQTIVEYVLLIVLVALAVFFASPSITSAIIGVFSRTSSVLGVTT